MGWSIGGPDCNGRFVGYGVPAYCDHPKCNATIDRGLSYVCSGQPFGGDHGCGLYFCEKHLFHSKHGFRCLRCCQRRPSPYKRIKPEHPRWIKHLLTHESWERWRRENPMLVRQLKATA